MLDMQNPEDRQIRNLLVGAGAAALIGFLGVATVIAVMIGANFNFLNWLE